MAKRTRQTIERIPYTPDEWAPDQLACHRSDDLNDAIHKSCSLAAGWYRRPVTVDWQVTEDNTERYMMRPTEVPPLDGWSPCYTMTAHNDDGTPRT